MRQHISDHHNRSAGIRAVYILLVTEVLVGAQILCVVFLTFGFHLHPAPLGTVVVTVVAVQALVLIEVLKGHGEAAGALDWTQHAVLPQVLLYPAGRHLVEEKHENKPLS